MSQIPFLHSANSKSFIHTAILKHSVYFNKLQSPGNKSKNRQMGLHQTKKFLPVGGSKVKR